LSRDVTSLRGRFLAYLDMLFVDHGIFRIIYNNLYALPGGLYRCSHPSPGQIRRYQRRYGIRTVINLRGADKTRRYALEEQTCAELGIQLVNCKGLKSRSAPDVDAIFRLLDVFERIEYPALVHCKSGADRGGIAAAFYRIFRLGEPVAQAMHELGWRYGHFRSSKAGVLDFFFENYLADNRREPVDFKTWLTTRYDQKALQAHYKSHGWADFVVDSVLHRE
jgi:protein tyrosine/serine phosphatase